MTTKMPKKFDATQKILMLKIENEPRGVNENDLIKTTYVSYTLHCDEKNLYIYIFSCERFVEHICVRYILT